MKTALKADFRSKTFLTIQNYTPQEDKKISFLDYKSYQKLIIVFILLSTILIVPESPTELEYICERHNSKALCNVW